MENVTDCEYGKTNFWIKDLDWPGRGIATTEALITIPGALITIPEALITIPEALITILEGIVILVDPTTILVHQLHQGQGTSNWIQFLTETPNVEIAQHSIVAQIIAIAELLCSAIEIVIALDNKNVPAW